MRYTESIKWGSHLDGIPNVYTYTFESGLVFVKVERKNIVTGTFSNTVRVTMPGQPEKASTLRSLRGFLDRGQRVAEL